MSQLSKLTKVNENISINRYDNDWMVQVGRLVKNFQSPSNE